MVLATELERRTEHREQAVHQRFGRPQGVHKTACENLGCTGVRVVESAFGHCHEFNVLREWGGCQASCPRNCGDRDVMLGRRSRLETGSGAGFTCGFLD